MVHFSILKNKMKNKIKDKNKSHNIDLFVWCSILFLGIIMMFNEKTDVI